jgi:hypothetical protein
VAAAPGRLTKVRERHHLSLLEVAIAGASFGNKVGPLQKKLLANARGGLAGGWNENEYQALSRSWQVWGIIASAAPLLALFLMVLKPGGLPGLTP